MCVWFEVLAALFTWITAVWCVTQCSVLCIDVRTAASAIRTGEWHYPEEGGSLSLCNSDTYCLSQQYVPLLCLIALSRLSTQCVNIPSVLTFEYSANETSTALFVGAIDETSFSFLIIQNKVLLVNCHSFLSWPAANITKPWHILPLKSPVKSALSRAS